ncbi:MAG: glucose 1-dehydrogenase [Candidatus Competibacteraceae bacterium]|nr:glucose 1-dehydrogenase [Candidatus Competibacteraceae bacterium]
MDTTRLQGRVALITGAGQGIGRAIARRYLQEGARVMIVDSDSQAANDAREEYHNLGSVACLQADVGHQEEVTRMVQATVEAFGHLDILVNNAGIMVRKPPTRLTVEEWNRVLAVNLTAPWLAARQAAEQLARRQGAIINIASSRALMSEPDTEAYSASKGGLVALTHALAVSLGPKVRVNAIAPGWIVVDEWRKLGQRQQPQLSEADHSQHPVGRVGHPEDIAALAAFLASPEAGFITGSCYMADGGMTRKMIYV